MLPKALDWAHGTQDPIWAYSLPTSSLRGRKQKGGTTKDSNYIAWLQAPATSHPGYVTPSTWPLFCWRSMYFCNPYLELLRTERVLPSNFKYFSTQYWNTQANSYLPIYNSNSTFKVHLHRSYANLTSPKNQWCLATPDHRKTCPKITEIHMKILPILYINWN